MRSMSGYVRAVWCARWLGMVAVFCAIELTASAADRARNDEGRELFNREWTRNDDRSHGGDGLGPVFNDSSCVACHNIGGVGGAGSASKNVDIITATPNRGFPVQDQPGLIRRGLRSLIGLEDVVPSMPPQKRKRDTRELVKAHAGFRTARSVVLHRFGDDPNYEQWRTELLGLGQFAPNFGGPGGGFARAALEMQQLKQQIQFRQFQTQGQAGEFALLHSQRNPTALFGAGLIDTIPAAALEAAAKAKHKDFPEIAGRVSRQKDGRIGRFGWKAQTPSLEDFVLTACAVELGLEVPGHHQGGLPRKPNEKAKGLDLNDGECASLVAFVGSIPRPIEAMSPSKIQNEEVASGKALFAKVGCASCHVARLGDVDGIYSDLLLHDMGPELGDVGQYGVFDPNSSEADFIDPEMSDEPVNGAPNAVAIPAPLAVATEVTPEAPGEEIPVSTTPAQGVTTQVVTQRVPFSNGVARRPTTGPASRQEWRTPPLWGLRDSGPYLHDGRADTLEQAVALHGGEGGNSAQKYFLLSTKERHQVEAFLKSLVAPTETDDRAR